MFWRSSYLAAFISMSSALGSQAHGATELHLPMPVQPGAGFIDVCCSNAPFEKTFRLYELNGNQMTLVAQKSIQATQCFARLPLAGTAAEGNRWVVELDNNVNFTSRAAIECAYINGDVDFDGLVATSDITAMQAELLSPGSNPVFVPQHADVDGDGLFTSADETYLAEFVNANGPAPVALPTGAELWNPDSVTPSDIDALIAGMGDQQSVGRPSYCYRALYSLGTAAVTKLITAASSTSHSVKFYGTASFSRISPAHAPTARLAEVQILLVEAMRLGGAPDPFVIPLFRKASGAIPVSSSELNYVITEYSAWDANWQGTVITLRDPVALSGILGPLIQFFTYRYVSGLNGEEEPGTSSGPYDPFSCFKMPNETSAGKWNEFLYSKVGGVRPWNCAGWALLCEKKFIWFDEQDGYQSMLAAFGFNGPPSSSGAGAQDGDICACFTDGELTHFYKRVDGKWTCKMGAGGPYIKNITSPERHYYDNCVGGDPSEHELTFEFYSMQ